MDHTKLITTALKDTVEQMHGLSPLQTNNTVQNHTKQSKQKWLWTFTKPLILKVTMSLISGKITILQLNLKSYEIMIQNLTL
jgi:hypothetical protein